MAHKRRPVHPKPSTSSRQSHTGIGAAPPKKQPSTSAHKKRGASITGSSVSHGSRKASNSRLTETIDASLNDLRTVYNSTLQKHKKQALVMEKQTELLRFEQRRVAEKDLRTKTDTDMNAALDMFTSL
ncbi:hypothetical protein BASA50_007464 [Batrachochytrium salamandrivorans]|uniref:No apical meristem-associated C-terminal domain-containing protein n=1 Tax=Batrachochytrium salamandrivorans TaxID=1357716 RepID=A0ABQ8F6T9_9FUNG|nr:hypothetical protein BASA60_000933 [Batrachochytrium salamandrivorans]KAH6586325.1 hypothetical protein BASA61_006615 [Batrachochytrium salamandrivorans]KAH6593258.1 hypothetical protein BASA50_007464 [Batrachochytrium salamandrivorans]KAH9274158.1 hypothetical protein BASA83_003462 [Batrachochytrium salamandrivorans]